MKKEINFSTLTGKIYLGGNYTKQDITDEVTKAVQILLHNGFTFDGITSSKDGKTYKLKLEEVVLK